MNEGEIHSPRTPLDSAPVVGTPSPGGGAGGDLRADGDDPSAYPDRFPTEEAQDQEHQRLFRLIEELVKWELTTVDR